MIAILDIKQQTAECSLAFFAGMVMQHGYQVLPPPSGQCRYFDLPEKLLQPMHDRDVTYDRKVSASQTENQM